VENGALSPSTGYNGIGHDRKSRCSFAFIANPGNIRENRGGLARIGCDPTAKESKRA